MSQSRVMLYFVSIRNFVVLYCNRAIKISHLCLVFFNLKYKSQITYPLKSLWISKDFFWKPLDVKGLIFKIFEIPLKFKGNRSLTFEVPLDIKIIPLLRSSVGVWDTYPPWQTSWVHLKKNDSLSWGGDSCPKGLRINTPLCAFAGWYQNVWSKFSF